MRGAATGEVPALHDALEALADAGTRDIDELADDEMIRRDLRADIDHVVGADTELRHLPLRLDRGGGEVTAERPRRVADLAQADAKLNGRIAILLDRALRHDLAIVDLEHGDTHLLARFREDAGHADLLCDHT